MKSIGAHSFNLNKATAAGFVLMFMVVLAALNVEASSEPREHTVEITNFVFEPAMIDARVGDTITWVNRDFVPHTATAEGGSWDTGSINKGESKSLVVTADMVSDYICRFHPTMKGSVDVTSD